MCFYVSLLYFLNEYLLMQNESGYVAHTIWLKRGMTCQISGTVCLRFSTSVIYFFILFFLLLLLFYLFIFLSSVFFYLYKPLSWGLTFNRSQPGSCSATQETLTQNFQDFLENDSAREQRLVINNPLLCISHSVFRVEIRILPDLACVIVTFPD